MVALVASLLTVHLADAAADYGRTAFDHYQAGSKAFSEERFDAAIAALNKSLALVPEQLRVVRLLGLSYQLAGHFDDAEAKFSDACRLVPKDAEAWFYLGRLYYIRNFFDKALSALQTAAKYAPNDARIHECLALTLEATGDSAAAEREYQQAIRGTRAQPGTVCLNYGALLLKLSRPQESEKLLLEAARLMPDSWQARFELAKLFYHTERFGAALRELKRALESTSKPEEWARTHALMAVVYSQLGRHDEADAAAAAAAK